MSFHIEVSGGKTVKLPTAGKYCDRDIVVTDGGYTEADLQASYAKGMADGGQLCAEKHFILCFTGDGNTSATFHVPFEPDVLHVFGYDPLGMNLTGAVMDFSYDRRAFGLLVGFALYGSGAGGVRNAALGSSAVPKRYRRAPDGTITVFDLGGTTATAVFARGVVYTVVAVKYTEQTDAERIAAFVDRLTGSGTVTLQQEKVVGAFTDDAWAALIAARPDWTFSWI